MTMQTGLGSDQQHDPQTGEVREPLSARASKNIQPRRHWDRVEGLVMRTPQQDDESEYELAFLAAQMEIQCVIETDAKAQITKDRSYSYTTLGQLMAHVRPILHKHGFTFKQGTGRIHKMGIDGGNTLYMPIYLKLTHVATSESETYVTEMPLIKLDPQAIKSVKTYAKRQLIEDTFGIASADDDAIAAMTRNTFSRDDEADISAGIIEKINGCKTIADLQKWAQQNNQALSGLSDEVATKCRKAYKDRLGELQEEPEGGKAKK
jgi:hypothetical protein